MPWIKNVLVDLAITVLIVVAAAMDLMWARWIVLVYTPFMLIIKLFVFLGGQSLGQLKQKGDGVPVWFYHALYAVNVAVPAGAALAAAGPALRHWWMIAGAWALIWILSIAAETRLRPSALRGMDG